MAKSKKEKRDAKAERAREIRHWMIDEGVWQIAQGQIYQLFTQRKDVLSDFVKTEGHTDWVWLEEGLSADLSDTDYYREANDLEQDAMYVAAFILAYNTIRSFHPLVRPPTWILPDMALVAGVKTVPKDTAEIVRDMLLQGRDAEAMLLISELAEGPFIVWRDGFFRGHAERARRGSDLLVTLPEADYFVSAVRFEGAASPLGIRDAVFQEPSLELGDVSGPNAAATAIGWAIRLFAEYGMTFAVQIVMNGGSDDDRYQWNNEIIFAITNDSGDAQMIERMMRPESENATA